MNQKDNSGALFRNKEKEKDTHPDYKGQAMIDGVEYYISSWLNESKNGVKYMSLSFKEKQEGGYGTKESNMQEAFDDDMPF